jgi:uncharacterized protein (TIGR03067 family)
MKLRVLLLLLAGSLVAADKPKEDDLQGNWSFVKAFEDAKDVTEDAKKLKVVIKKSKLTLIEGMQSHVTRLTLDSTKKPKRIDFEPTDGRFKDMTLKGIYTLEGDTLTIYLADPDQIQRPREIPMKGSAGHFLMVLKRMK